MLMRMRMRWMRLFFLDAIVNANAIVDAIVDEIVDANALISLIKNANADATERPTHSHPDC